MVDFSNFNSLVDVALYFDTVEKCKETIAQARWKDGNVVCPYCGQQHCHRRRDGRYVCKNCNHNFSEMVGTIFENTKVSLVKWFMAMYLISSHKKGISSHQLHRDLHITQKTAWYMLQKIRSLYSQDDSVALEGEVECDEMYLGGRAKNKHKNKRVKHTQGKSLLTKEAIFGMAERTGRTAAFHVKDTKAETLRAYIGQFVADNACIFTDESKCYYGLKEHGFNHQFVNHSAGEFANKEVTTNSIEGFWAHFKRMVFGTYHFVSSKYLQRYIDEAVYRWNTRKFDEQDRFTYMFEMALSVFDYHQVKMDFDNSEKISIFAVAELKGTP